MSNPRPWHLYILRHCQKKSVWTYMKIVSMNQDQVVIMNSDQAGTMNRDQAVTMNSDQAVTMNCDQAVTMNRDQAVTMNHDQAVCRNEQKIRHHIPPAKPLHNSDTVSVYFNNIYCTEICDKLSKDLAMFTYIYLDVDEC